MRVVLDTNILISALITSMSASAQLIALWRSRKFDLLTCPQQLEEFARATRYPQLRARLSPTLAEAGAAQFLVTGDKPLLGLKRHKSTRIVTPAALIELLKDGNK